MKEADGFLFTSAKCVALALPVYAEVSLDAINPEKARVHWQSQCHTDAAKSTSVLGVKAAALRVVFIGPPPLPCWLRACEESR